MILYNYIGDIMKLIIGSHVGYRKDGLYGSVLEAISYGANTFMIYTGAPQNTFRTPINIESRDKAYSLMKENDINIEDVIVHAPYIINLANPKNIDFSKSFLKQELQRCETLGIDKLVLHPGSHVGLGEDVAIKNIVEALNEILNPDIKVTICIETMAGKGSEVGKNLDEIKKIIEGINLKDKIGVCLDTCHLNDAGYSIANFDEFLDKFNSIIGIDYIKCIHINDSKNILGSRKDRHENIGFGEIGFDNLINVIYNPRLENIPKILETPYIDDFPPYKFEIEMIRNKEYDDSLKDKIIEYYK